MSEMIERAAQAAIEAERAMRGIDLGSPAWGKLVARAVLQAIREPSGALLDMIGLCSTVTDWHDMIDAALAE